NIISEGGEIRNGAVRTSHWNLPPLLFPHSLSELRAIRLHCFPGDISLAGRLRATPQPFLFLEQSVFPFQPDPRLQPASHDGEWAACKLVCGACCNPMDCGALVFATADRRPPVGFDLSDHLFPFAPLLLSSERLGL